MMLALVVWLVMTVFPAIGWMGFVAGIVAAGYIFLFGFVCMVTSDSKSERETHEFCKRRLKSKVWKVLLIVWVVGMLTPSKETSWYMVGAYATQTIAQSDTAQELAGDGVDVLKALMKKAKNYVEDEQVKEEPKK